MIDYKKLLSPLIKREDVESVAVYVKRDAGIKSTWSSTTLQIDEDTLEKILSKEGVHGYKRGRVLAATFCKETISASIIILTKEETKGGIRGALQRVSKEVFLHILHEQMQERVDRLKALRSSLVTNISHQLRTPLSVIKAALQLLSEERVGRVGPDAERLLQIANKNIEKIVEFIERLSQFAQIEYEGLDMNKRWTDVSKVVEQAYRRVKEEAEKKQVELSVKVGKELFAMADPERLEEAIFQGMANAVKFTLSGGKIKVVAKKAGKQVKVEISDTGIGLAPEDVEKVFSEFFRTDDAALYHPRGSGLGLAIARSIIKAHGGQVLMRSKPGKGCCLTFLLPKE